MTEAKLPAPDRGRIASELVAHYLEQAAVLSVVLLADGGQSVRVLVARRARRPIIITLQIRGVGCETAVIDETDLPAVLEGRHDLGPEWDVRGSQLFARNERSAAARDPIPTASE